MIPELALPAPNIFIPTNFEVDKLEDVEVRFRLFPEWLWVPMPNGDASCCLESKADCHSAFLVLRFCPYHMIM